MSKKDLLKEYLKSSPRERRISLENFIDNEIYDKDISNAIRYMKELESKGTTSHGITEMGYSDSGDFYVKAETGLTFL